MALVCPNVGEILLLKYILGIIDAGNPVLHLYTNNVTPSDTTVKDDLVECDTVGYVPITLASSNWVVSQDGSTGLTMATFAERSFSLTTATRLYGYYVTDTSNNLLWLEKFETVYDLPEDGGNVGISPSLNIT